MKPESSKTSLPPEVGTWLLEQPDADRRALEEAWRLTEHGRPTMTPSDERRKMEVWAAVSGATQRTDREAMPRPRLRRVPSRTWRWVAAAAVIAILMGVGYVLRPITVHAPLGQFADAVLPDGSTVRLNSGSSITYRAHFIGTRSVELEGEAYFEVVKDDDRFVVETFNARTTVLGTEFNVRARQQEDAPVTAVVLAEGRVEVTSAVLDDDGVILSPGEQTIVSASKVPSQPQHVELERALAWLDGGLYFTNESMSSIFAEIERRYDVNVDVPVDIRTESLSIYLNDPASPEGVIRNVVIAKSLKYRETANGYEVYRP